MCFGLTSCKNTKEAKNTLTIKKFHLGMEYASAKELIKQYIKGSSLEKASQFQLQADGFTLISQLTDDEIKVAQRLANFAGRELSHEEEWEKIAVVKVDEQRKVIYFKINSDLSKILFNSGDLTNEEFAQMFVNEYEIPNVSPVYFSDGVSRYLTNWAFTNHEGGWHLEIGADKSVSLEQRIKVADRGFD